MNTNTKTYKVKVNEFIFSFTGEELNAVDITRKSNGDYSVIKNYKSTNAQVTGSELTGKKATVEIAGESFNVEIKDELDQMLELMGFGVAATRQIKEIKAPMPGLVLEISVSDGDQVYEGDRILILEAMKMENSIMIHADATIKKILVKPGQAVDKGEILVELV